MLNHKRRMLLALGGALLVCGGLFYVFAASRPKSLPRITQSGTRRQEAKSRRLVRRTSIWHQLRPALDRLADRVERPGNERLSITGLLTPAGESQPQPVQLVLEFPDRLRLTVQNGLNTRVTTFDDAQERGRGKSLDQHESDLVESLVYDSPEHFFLGQTEGMATRSLGLRFRASDGAAYDIYQVSDVIKVADTPRIQIKTYHFNSDSHLLEKVRYQSMQNGVPTQVETRIEWQKLNGQQLPARILRFENEQAVYTLVITSISAGSRADDGLFAAR